MPRNPKASVQFRYLVRYEHRDENVSQRRKSYAENERQQMLRQIVDMARRGWTSRVAVMLVVDGYPTYAYSTSLIRFDTELSVTWLREPQNVLSRRLCTKHVWVQQ